MTPQSDPFNASKADPDGENTPKGTNPLGFNGGGSILMNEKG